MWQNFKMAQNLIKGNANIIQTYFYFNIQGTISDSTISDSTKHVSIWIPHDAIMSLWIDDPDQSHSQKEIIPNKMQRYSSTKEYLEIHYRLLLEDFIYALRSDLTALKGISSGKV